MFEKKRIRSLALQKLNRGISKEQIVDELLSEMDEKQLIYQVLDYLPTKLAREKFGKYNSFLLVGLIFFFLIDIAFLDFYSFPLILLDLSLIWLVGSYRLRWYGMIGLRLLGAITLLVASQMKLALKNSDGFYWFMLGASLFLLVYALVLSWKLRKG